MDIPEKTGEALHLFAQTPRKWELSLVFQIHRAERNGKQLKLS